MAITINIEPVKVQEFPEVKYANKIHIYNVMVNIVDNGVSFDYSLIDENGEQIFQGKGFLTNDEIANWTTTDNQLVDAILNKLKLTRVEV